MTTAREVVDRWMAEAGRNGSGEFLHSGDGMVVDKETHILSIRRRLTTRENGRSVWGPVTQLAIFVGSRYNSVGLCLLNGDGFTDNIATDWQSRLREESRRTFGVGRVALIPFQALRAAQIQLPSIRSIEISEDHEETRQHAPEPLKGMPQNLGTSADMRIPLLETMAISSKAMADLGWAQNGVATSTSTNQTWEGEYEGMRLRINFRRRETYAPWTIHSISMWAQPEFGQFAWQNLSWGTNYVEGMSVLGWWWSERIHRLGAVVFSGISEQTGRRHRYISAFDMQEPGGLYFLAMLPDQGPIKTYTEAIDSLAPPMVHQARRDGRTVIRQGDVFAIETKLTDEEVFSDTLHDGTATHVRRDIAMQNSEQRFAQGMRLEAPLEGEVRERIPCVCCDSRVWVGNGPLARSALSIFQTGHTADEVVVKNNGVTFIRGRMYHDPMIHDPERTAPDHQTLDLGPPTTLDQRKWFVAIRNTVPSQRARRNPQLGIQEVESDNEPLRRHRRRVEELAST